MYTRFYTISKIFFIISCIIYSFWPSHVKEIKPSSLFKYDFFEHDYHNCILFGRTKRIYALKDDIQWNGDESVYNYNNKYIVSLIFYKNHNGQVGLIDTNPHYRNQGITTFMLKEIENELSMKKISEIWVACSKDHYFWSKQKGYCYKKLIHPTIHMGGYFKKLHEINDQCQCFNEPNNITEICPDK